MITPSRIWRALAASSALACCLAWAGRAAAVQESPFHAHVRPTEPLTPELERDSFDVPDGFRVDLVAAEPDIFKPMNLAFDTRGRLWVTVSQEYPFAAPADRPGRDAVKILEDRDGDGRADRVTTFADGLNIPIGVYPCRGGAIVHSIPNIWFLEDTDGDDVADRRTVLYGPMGYERDTHGMNNAFRRGYDGWLYACHGFSNETRVRGADGHEVHMVSGNTYRMRLDGRRIEQFTSGQVNPFGMAIDARFDLFTADCHSKPIYQLIRDGSYPSFGKPHDGLGFVPPMMDHLHGSTAIGGVAAYSADRFPEPFRDNLFCGNVMTSRVNRNTLIGYGSTWKCREEDDFVKTSDPWFRPVDIRLGPDGALYIADFYNRIIGHYEVPLEHPGRDRTRGRIWRVTYAPEGDAEPRGPFDLSSAETSRLIEWLGDGNLARRLLALDELTDRVGPSAESDLRRAADGPASPSVRSNAMWALHRLGLLDEDHARRLLGDADPFVRLHAMKEAGERGPWSEEFAARVRAGLADGDPFVRRAAADAIGRHPESRAATDLLDTLGRIDSADVLLRQNVRIALRNQLRGSGGLSELASRVEDPASERELAHVALGLSDDSVAGFLLRALPRHNLSPEDAAEWIRHAARCAGPNDIEPLIAAARERGGATIEGRTTLIDGIRRGAAARDGKLPESLVGWARELAGDMIRTVEPDPLDGWTHHAIASAPRSDDPWVMQDRPSADGVSARFVCSLPRGETRTGRLRSPPFAAPAKLAFFVAGHSGLPNRPLTDKNLVRLCDASTGEPIRTTPPPRNDVARRVEWDLSDCVDRQVRLEIVDGDDANAYAWLALGRIEPDVIRLPRMGSSERADRFRGAAAVIRDFRLAEFEPTLREWLARDPIEASVASAIAEGLLALRPQPGFELLTLALADPDTPAPLAASARALLVSRDPRAFPELAGELMRAAPARSQQRLALALAVTPDGLGLLIDLIAQGKASPRMIQGAAVIDRIRAIGGDAIAARAAELTAGLAPPRETIAALIEEKRRAHAESAPDAERGAAVFTKSCAVCHQIGGKGQVVGPQLDGIGNRGLERILEDVLDPNRNVDGAFRTSTLQLADGRVVTGLVRGERDRQVILADDKGREFTVARDAIEKETKATVSLMPENLTADWSDADFHDLIAYLLAHRSE